MQVGCQLLCSSCPALVGRSGWSWGVQEITRRSWLGAGRSSSASEGGRWASVGETRPGMSEDSPSHGQEV